MELRRATLAKLLAVVFVVNLVVMSAGAVYAYEQAPPIPEAVDGPNGTVVTDAEVRAGKAVFQRNGLMNHGSILGNGAYFGVDFTADALALKTEGMQAFYAEREYGTAYDELSSAQQAAVDERVQSDLADGQHSAAETSAHERVRETYVERYHEGSDERGVPAGTIPTAEGARRFADFALWTAWVAHTDRAGADGTYTNDWPHNPAAGNEPTGTTFRWSVISVFLLVAALGAGVALYRSVELPEVDSATIETVPPPQDVSVTPSQLAAVRYVLVAAGLFLAQTLLGAFISHYYVERSDFFGLGAASGVDIFGLLPFMLARTWHIDLAIMWITTLWLGAGLFLAPLLTGYEPPKQARYVTALLVALVVVVVGGLAGIWLGSQGYIDHWWLFGNEGLEYLEVGRVWQVALLSAMGGWLALVARGFRPLLAREEVFGLGHLTLYSGGSIGLLFVAGMLYTPETNMVMTEFWRWWVVHMWVEGAFEFFVVAVIAVTFVSMGLLSRTAAEKAVAFQALFVMGTAVIGVGHHYWWIGQAELWLPLGTIFSTLEFIPLVFILFESVNRYRSLVASSGFRYRLPFVFIVASGFWNFLGAGVMGVFINLPIINYYEHGTYLSVAHAHAAMFGAFGLLALGLAVYALQLTTRPEAWWPAPFRAAFWLWNVGLAVMVFVSLTPVGFLQLETSFTEGYAAARSLAFYESELVQTLLWLRLPGDTLVIAGALVFLTAALRAYRHRRDPTAEEEAAEHSTPAAPPKEEA
jgi:nitric oxide reductase subunit B